MIGQIGREDPQSISQKLIELKEAFIARYHGETEDLRIFAAPGRVNLIGEHIDYCGGFVFPAALTLETVVIARRRADRLLCIGATDLPDQVRISLDELEKGKQLRWGQYQLGVADELQKAGYPLCGADLLYHVNVPFGAGLSSSASIELATAIALVTLGQELTGSKQEIDRIRLAVISQLAEHRYVGVNCGIMDQFASAMGKKGHAILLDCATLAYQYAPLDLGDYCLVLANTMKKHSLGESKYNMRVQETSAGFAILKNCFPDRKYLCDISSGELASCEGQIADPVILRRVKHVITENERVKLAYQALSSHDLAAFAALLNQAQASIRDLYEVTGFELDTMVAEACAAQGCIAARMTGAGFGGCTVNLVHADCVNAFIRRTGEKYQQKTGLQPEFYICESGDGAREII